MTRESESAGTKDYRPYVKKVYQSISNPDRPTDAVAVRMRVDSIRDLESLLKTTFLNSRDFRRKVEKYLEHYDGRRKPIHERIRKARRKKKWSQTQLAIHLGYKSHVPIANFESARRYPPDRVFQWLEEEGM